MSDTDTYNPLQRWLKQGKELTRGELLTELRKPGQVYVPVACKHDILHVKGVKSDLIDQFEGYPEEGSGFCGVRRDATLDNALWLDIAH